MMPRAASGTNSRMRIVTYARVSTKGQRETSLKDQEKRFAEWEKSSGHTRVQKYAEAMSGGNNMQKETFLAMLEELPMLDVEALVVDSLDRFTRDKIAGTAMTHQLREMGVKLWELDFSANEPFDFTVDEHRDYVTQRFADAEAERRRIKRRQLKRYAEQQNRGATTTNRPGFGLKLQGEERGKRWIAADPDTAWIVQEVDKRILAGESQCKVLEWLKTLPAPGIWKSRRGLTLALLNKAYEVAGVRTPETQSALRELHGSRRQPYGDDRATTATSAERPVVHVVAISNSGSVVAPGRRRHGLSGLIACGRCVDEGHVDPCDARMHGRYIQRNPNPYSLVCSGSRGGKTIHKKESYVSTHFVVRLLGEKLLKLRDREVAEKVLERWAKEPTTTKVAQHRRGLERSLTAIDRQLTDLDAMAHAAVKLAVDGDPGMVDEAKRVLANVKADRMELQAQREAVQSQVNALPVPRSRSPQVERLRVLMANAELFSLGRVVEEDGMSFKSGITLLELAKPWVDALGPPIFRRVKLKGRKKPRLDLEWTYIDRVRPEPAPDYPDVPELYAEAMRIFPGDSAEVEALQSYEKSLVDRGWLDAEGNVTELGQKMMAKRQWPKGSRERDPDPDSLTFRKLVKKQPTPPKAKPSKRIKK